VCFTREKQARAGSRNGQKKVQVLTKNIKKSGPLIIGDRGVKTGSNYYSHSSSIVFANIRDTPLYLKMS
jgi:hypothetical protein